MESLPRLSEETTKRLTEERKKYGPMSERYMKHRTWLEELVDFTNDPVIDNLEPKMIREYLFGSDFRPLPNLADNRIIAPDNYIETYKITYVRRFFEMVSQKYFITSPMVIPTEDEKIEAIHPFADKEIEKILEACKYIEFEIINPDCVRDQAIFMFSIDTGLFLMYEAIKGDIDIQNGIVDIQWNAFGERYQVNLSRRTRELIASYMSQRKLELRKTPYSYLFSSALTNDCLSDTEVYWILQRISKASGVEINRDRIFKTYCTRYLLQNENFDGLYYFGGGECFYTERLINFFNLSNSEFEKLRAIRKERSYRNSSSNL